MLSPRGGLWPPDDSQGHGQLTLQTGPRDTVGASFGAQDIIEGHLMVPNLFVSGSGNWAEVKQEPQAATWKGGHRQPYSPQSFTSSQTGLPSQGLSKNHQTAVEHHGLPSLGSPAHFRA